MKYIVRIAVIISMLFVSIGLCFYNAHGYPQNTACINGCEHVFEQCVKHANKNEAAEDECHYKLYDCLYTRCGFSEDDVEDYDYIKGY